MKNIQKDRSKLMVIHKLIDIMSGSDYHNNYKFIFTFLQEECLAATIVDFAT